MTGKFAMAVLAFALCALAGCVSKAVDPEPVKSSTSQNHAGLVTISWQSKIGYTYHLVAYEDGRIFQDKKVYEGTGDTITVQFKRDSSKPLPEYRVMHVPSVGR